MLTNSNSRLRVSNLSSAKVESPNGAGYEVVVESRLDDWGLKATAVWTGVPMGIAAELVGAGEALDTGAKPPERALDPEQFIGELADRGIEITETQVE